MWAALSTIATTIIIVSKQGGGLWNNPGMKVRISCVQLMNISVGEIVTTEWACDEKTIKQAWHSEGENLEAAVTWQERSSSSQVAWLLHSEQAAHQWGPTFPPQTALAQLPPLPSVKPETRNPAVSSSRVSVRSPFLYPQSHEFTSLACWCSL